MGNAASNIVAAKNKIASAAVVEGHYVNDFKTGRRWVTDPIVSDSTVQKKPYPMSLPGFPAEVWGPYQKKFTTTAFGQNFMTPPETVDGVPILCRCRDIYAYARDQVTGNRPLGVDYALVMGDKPPACWEDTEGFQDPVGGSTFNVITRHPEFYAYAANQYGVAGIAAKELPFLLGGKTRRRARQRPRKATQKKRSHYR
jgi:hypothetical protein